MGNGIKEPELKPKPGKLIRVNEPGGGADYDQLMLRSWAKPPPIQIKEKIPCVQANCSR